jgi:hypothetical protein
MRIMALVLASFSGSVFRGYGFSRGQACGGSSKPAIAEAEKDKEKK